MTRARPARSRRAPAARRPPKRALTQLHLALDASVLRACPRCRLSYTVGAPDDEALHRAHCTRVQRGMEWGREEQRDAPRAAVREVASPVKLRDGSSGRIVCFPATATGKVGSKLAHLLDTIDLALASPPLTDSILKCSKAYLFLLPPTPGSHRERIVGCVIAQRISSAMQVAAPAADRDSPSLVAVDASSGLFCHPSPLPTPLGIPRLFVPSAHRRQGIASHLLSAAAATFIHGCPLDPIKGQVAFTQPTEGGCAVMRKWGKGFVRIYQE